MSGNQAPIIILHAPQLGENIGAAARVMLNFGLTELRLVAPRDGWPNNRARPLSAGAFEAGVNTNLFETIDEAIADIQFILAATARPRGLQKEVVGASGAAELIHRKTLRTGLIFGAENNGMPTEVLALADAIMTYPVNPDFASLNLAQAVGVFCAAWGAQTGRQGRFEQAEDGIDPPAPREDLLRMFEHFEEELERAGYFYPPEKTAVMVNNFRTAFLRGAWTLQEVRTFRGAIKALAMGRGKARGKSRN